MPAWLARWICTKAMPQLPEPSDSWVRGVAEAAPETVDQGGQGVDGQAGLVQLGRLQGQVQGGQLEQAEGVVGDHHLGRRTGQLVAQAAISACISSSVGLPGGAVTSGRSEPGQRAVGEGRAGPGGSVARLRASKACSLRYPMLKTEYGKRGLGPHPATRALRASGASGSIDRLGRALLPDVCPFFASKEDLFPRSDAA